jgi:phosphoribulokinase
MSKNHPIIAVTGSAGAGTTTVRHAFADMFRRQSISAALVKGNSFFRYEREEMDRLIAQSGADGRPVSLFGPDCNLFDKLESLFANYGKNGSGELRHYVQDEADAQHFGLPVGKFTPWEKIPKSTDLLFYEGMHGGVAAHTWTRRRSSPAHLPTNFRDRRGNGKAGQQGVNAAQHVDLLLGIVPAVNLEWIQKIHRDCSKTGCTVEAVTATILRRLRDYAHFIVPQFGLTDINIQRMPLVDTSDPFIARDVPSADESILVIHFRDPQRFDFPDMMRRVSGSFMSRRNTMVVPGGKLKLALDVICTPLISAMMDRRGKRGVA